MNGEFESIYRVHVDAVFRYSLRLAGDRDLAADFTSEAFLELFRNWDSIQVDRLPGWLFTVVKNRAVDHWRKASAERRYVESVEGPVTLPAEELDLQAWLRSEPALKPIHRVCLILHFVQGMTRSEIAKRLALSETQVKGHLQYALQLLRKAWNCAGTGERHAAE